nr:CinA family protein [Motiliproteus sediminis]
MVAQLAEQLERRGVQVTTAESCTGGAIASALTERSGSSVWFEYGFVTYSNAAKHALLGVEEAIFEQHGAVSQACVEAMLHGALRVSGAAFGVAVSGVAGPGGGTPEKPVGTVWLSWGERDHRPHSSCFQFQGDRQQIRQQAVIQAVSALLGLAEK